MIDLETERLIQALHNRYMRVIDDDQLELWPELFMPDGIYSVTTRENHDRGLPLAVMSCKGRGMMQDRISGMRKINVFEPHRYSHQTSGMEISRMDDGTFQCISNFLVIRTMHAGASMMFACGIYQDVVRRNEEGQMRFCSRKVITDSRQTDTLLVIPL
jgi:anthranilate 1,2-dioxygenase small subunit